MSDIIRFFGFGEKKKPLVPEPRYSNMDEISDAQRDFMRLPEGVASELWDGLLRPGDERDSKPMPLKPFTGRQEDNPEYPTNDPTLPPRHRRT